jgi:putative ABC transport system permease protein
VDLRTIALGNLRRRKGKAALVVLGLAVAVAAFVLVLSLVFSLRATMDDKLSRYGSNMVVTPGSTQLSLTYGGVSVAGSGSGEVRYLQEADLARLRAVPSGKEIAAAVPVLLQPVKAGGRSFLAMGTDLAESAKVKLWWRVVGRLPSRSDEVLLGLNVRNALNLDPGKTLMVDGRAFTVAGVLQETGGEEDNLVLMPLAALADLSGRKGRLNLIEVTAASTTAVDTLTREIEAAVPGSSVVSVKKSIEFTNQANSSLANFGLAVTLLIVVISGLVVLITMLTSVKERQKEIGVFRAVGYKQRHIAKLVLIEAGLLSAAGAVVGVTAGLVAAFVVPLLVRSLSLTMAPNLVVIVAGVALAFVVGLLAALYPARRAANMDPATALKYI